MLQRRLVSLFPRRSSVGGVGLRGLGHVTIRSRQFVLVVLGQAVCVAVGLFMQRQLFCSAVRDAAEREVWATLEAAAGQLRGALAHSGPDQFHAAVEQLGPVRFEVVLVDEGWQPQPGGGAQAPVQFTPLSESAPSPRANPNAATAKESKPVRGMLAGPDGPHFAVVLERPDSGQRLLVHEPRTDVDAATAAALRGLLPVDLVTFLWTIALLGMTVYLLTTRHQEVLEHERARSTSDALRQTQEIIRTRDAVIFALAKLAGSRDHETGGHLERISAYSTLLATALRDHPVYGPHVTPTFVRLIEISSVLHDIGKVGIEDSVLRKPGRLTPAEHERMQHHTVIAGQCLAEITQRLGNSNFLEMARGGYPHGLKGKQIPLAARIIAIADVYDALAAPRVYKAALPHEDCFAIIAAGAGQQFDPDLVAVALTLRREFREILQRHLRPGPAGESSRFVPQPGTVDAARNSASSTQEPTAEPSSGAASPAVVRTPAPAEPVSPPTT
jgi:hypothetical protein